MDHREKPGTPGDILEHHGVKGMRWGKRKEDDPTSRNAKGLIEPTKATATRVKEEPKRTSAKETRKEEPVSRDVSGRVMAKSVPPLSEKRQKKVDKFLKRADVMEARVSEIKVSNEALKGTKNPFKAYDRYLNTQNIKTLERQQKQAVRDAESVKKGKLTRKQKQVIAGAVGVAAIVGAAYVLQGQQSGAFNSWKLMGQARLRGQSVPFKMNKELSKSMSASDLLNKVAKPVNPGYSKMGGKMNCRRSTYAYELRRRGFDVHATTSSVGYGQSESGVINALTTKGKDFFAPLSLSRSVVETGGSNVAKGDKRIAPGVKTLVEGLARKGNIEDLVAGGHNTASSSQKVLEELAKQPHGARGEVMFKFPSFGHSMAWENINGVPHIFDSQKGTLYHAAGKMVESKWDGFHSAEIRRLDNMDLDLNFLSRWATNVRGK